MASSITGPQPNREYMGDNKGKVVQNGRLDREPSRFIAKNRVDFLPRPNYTICNS